MCYASVSIEEVNSVVIVAGMQVPKHVGERGTDKMRWWSWIGANCGGCPAGYCMGANNCRRCDVGHEAPKKGMENCTRCAPGRFGPSVGLVACEPCPIGSYCPQHENGTVTPTLCPIGFHCPVRSLPFPVSCNPGYYCPERGMNTPRLCPAGFSCPQSRTFNPTPCPENYFCSGGTISPERCPTLYRSRTKAAKCSAAPAFFAIIVIAVIVVFCVAFGIYFFRDKWMPGPDPENHISTKRAQSPGERSRLMMAQDEDDIAYHGT